MDLLHTLLNNRMGQAPVPDGTLPTVATKVPPRTDRFITSQLMQQAYRNGWNPNPMLIRVADRK